MIQFAPHVTALAGATLAMEMVCLYAYRHKLG